MGSSEPSASSLHDQFALHLSETRHDVEEDSTGKCLESPVSTSDLAYLEQAAGWTLDDARLLAAHANLFRAKAESTVDSWRAVIGSQRHLAHRFVRPDDTLDEQYKASVKRRCVQWIVDVAVRSHDQAWLDYQQEIGLRHTPAKKNKMDGADTPLVVPFRYLLGFVPVVLPIRQFLKDDIKDPEELQKLEDAWRKAVLVHVTLWARGYVSNFCPQISCRVTQNTSSRYVIKIGQIAAVSNTTVANRRNLLSK